MGLSFVVLFWSSASDGRADDAVVGELGPIRHWVAQNTSVAAQIPLGPPHVRAPLPGGSHAKQGAIAGAVIGGLAGGAYLGGMVRWGCAESHPHRNCDAEALGWAAAGAAGGALAGGVVGGLIGSLFQTVPSAGPEPSRARTTLTMVPAHRGFGVAVSHSF